MHKLFLLLTITFFGKVYGQESMELKHMSFNEKLTLASSYIDKIESVKEAPKSSDEAFSLRNSIDHPVYSKNKGLGYCLNGVMPLGRRVSLEIPFKIGRKRACKKSVPKMLEKAKHVLNSIYIPFFGNALKLKEVAQSLLADENLAFNKPELYMALKRLDMYTNRKTMVGTTIGNKTYYVTDGLAILATKNEVDLSMGYRNFGEMYKRFLGTIDIYSQNFRYDGFNKYIKVLKKEFKERL